MGLGCSTACGILPDWGSNPCPPALAGGLPTMSHQGSPYHFIFKPYKCIVLFKRLKKNVSQTPAIFATLSTSLSQCRAFSLARPSLCYLPHLPPSLCTSLLAVFQVDKPAFLCQVLALAAPFTWGPSAASPPSPRLRHSLLLFSH